MPDMQFNRYTWELYFQKTVFISVDFITVLYAGPNQAGAFHTEMADGLFTPTNNFHSEAESRGI
jgi:hypothetical protein